MPAESLVNKAHRGSFFLDKYELRITQRCLEEDLGCDPATPFEQLAEREIVKALIKDRAAEPRGGKTVGPSKDDATVYRLAYGDDHRGATWFDPVEKVVWLCAYHGQHRSGEEDDSFPYFLDLIKEQRIKPTEEDYALLFEERDDRFLDLLPDDATALLDKARNLPGTECTAVVGGEATVGVAVHIVETLEETYVAFSLEEVGYDRYVQILVAFFPDASYTDWEEVQQLPTRKLGEGEICHRILRESSKQG